MSDSAKKMITSCLVEAVEKINPAMEEYAGRGTVDGAADRLAALNDIFWNPSAVRLPMVQGIKATVEKGVSEYANAARRKLKGEEPHDHNCGGAHNHDCGDGEEHGCGGNHRHINDDLRDYQLCLYMYSMAAFLEAAFGGSDPEDALDDIEDYSVEYQMIYTSCCNNVTNYAVTSSKSDKPELAGEKMSKQAIAFFTVTPENVTRPFLDALE